ncbi:MAG TPA: hypothetical protein VND63_00030, partial [Rhodanobacteraceae bacterium]|nr:hypothetical protein [Rhodanobacteraceae bacterium]
AHAYAGAVFELRQAAALASAHGLTLAFDAAEGDAALGYALETMAAARTCWRSPRRCAAMRCRRPARRWPHAMPRRSRRSISRVFSSTRTAGPLSSPDRSCTESRTTRSGSAQNRVSYSA